MRYSYNNIEIEIDFNRSESEVHIEADLKTVMDYGVDRLIRERYIPWLKNEQFSDKEDGQIFDGLKLTNILYSYGRIIAKYSPTGMDDCFGQFEFDFESCSDYTADMLEAAAMQVYIKEGKIVRVSGYDI